MYENLPYPPSLAKDGEIRTGTKSELLSCIENVFQISVTPTETESSSIQKNVNTGNVSSITTVQTHVQDVEVLITEGSVLVNILKLEKKCTFEDYAKKGFYSTPCKKVVYCESSRL